MRIIPALLFTLAVPLGATPPPNPLPEPGIYTNEEAVYFAAEKGQPKPTWRAVKIGPDARWQWIDAYGKPQSEWQGGAIPGLARGDSGWLLNGTEMRRAATFTCWMSIRKHAAKADGSPDYTFAGKLPMFDQGGRVMSGGGDAPEAIFRLPTVYWPAPSTNKPSLVLYVHTPDKPDSAVSYAWADPEAKLIGINLRWVQGSCTRDAV